MIISSQKSDNVIIFQRPKNITVKWKPIKQTNEKEDKIQPFLELPFALLQHHLKEIAVYKIKTTL